MSRKKKIAKIIIPIVIILSGLLVMKSLIAGRPEPKKEVRKDLGALVQVLKVQKQDVEILVRGTGTVRTKQKIDLTPQISGRVTFVSPRMVVGGFFKKDELLFEIEDTDYRLALDRASAARAKAEYELATIESQARIARAEWERLNGDSAEPPNPLVLYEPQLKNAKAALASAEAAVEQARLDLERTKLRAPFNCRVSTENIGLGQYVKSGSTVAVLAGTDAAEIFVPLPADDLRWLTVPRTGEDTEGSPALASVTVGDRSHEWEGRIVRSTGEVDPKTRMMKVVVEIDDPYGLRDGTDPDLPVLAEGTFVEITIMGKTVKDVFVIPRNALRDDSTVWLADDQERLRIKKVVPLRLERNEAVISEGLEDDDLVVLTNLAGAADGMELRVMR